MWIQSVLSSSVAQLQFYTCVRYLVHISVARSCARLRCVLSNQTSLLQFDRSRPLDSCSNLSHVFLRPRRDDNYWLDLAGLSDTELNRPKTPVKMATSAAGLVPPRSKSAAIFSANTLSTCNDNLVNRCSFACDVFSCKQTITRITHPSLTLTSSSLQMVLYCLVFFGYNMLFLPKTKL